MRLKRKFDDAEKKLMSLVYFVVKHFHVSNQVRCIQCRKCKNEWVRVLYVDVLPFNTYLLVIE